MATDPSIVEKRGFIPIYMAEGSTRRTFRAGISRYDGVEVKPYESDTGSASETTAITISVPRNHKVAIEYMDIYTANNATLKIYSFDGSTEELVAVFRVGAPGREISPPVPIVIEKDGLTEVRIKYAQEAAGAISITVIARKLRR